MKALNRIMSALGYVPRSKIDVGSLEFSINIDSASMDAAIEKLGRMHAAARAAEEAMNSAAALADFGCHDLCAESGRDLVLTEVRAQRDQLAKVLKILESQGRAIARSVCVADASGLPG